MTDRAEQVRLVAELGVEVSKLLRLHPKTEHLDPNNRLLASFSAAMSAALSFALVLSLPVADVLKIVSEGYSTIGAELEPIRERVLAEAKALVEAHNAAVAKAIEGTAADRIRKVILEIEPKLHAMQGIEYVLLVAEEGGGALGLASALQPGSVAAMCGAARDAMISGRGLVVHLGGDDDKPQDDKPQEAESSVARLTRILRGQG